MDGTPLTTFRTTGVLAVTVLIFLLSLKFVPQGPVDGQPPLQVTFRTFDFPDFSLLANYAQYGVAFHRFWLARYPRLQLNDQFESQQSHIQAEEAVPKV